MYITEINISSFRHLEDVQLGPFKRPPAHSDLVVLAGPNGGGKSSILELLGYALSNTWSLSWSLGRSFPSNSFEVAIAVTPDELALVREFTISSQDTSAGSPDSEALRHLEQEGIYYRAYNFDTGQYQQNSSVYNRIHRLVTSALRNHYQRSLGFFLKSDRHYPPGKFRRERLFDYEEMTELKHIWALAFNTSDVQYKDMFDFLVQQRYHYFRRLGAYWHRRQATGSADRPAPTDPLSPYSDLLRKLFPQYKFADPLEDVPTDLFIQLPSGETIPFSDLSSGEKEVFFILSFFLRHDVTNAVIVIDEPELHLHPELARLLIRSMQSIKEGNQVWLATHNPEIIDEAGRDRVVYIARDSETKKSVVTLGTDESEAMRHLKDLFGYCGYIGIAKRIVFLEGADSSADRKMFSSLFPEYGSALKFVPIRSVANLPRMNAAILSILESKLGWAEFYLIRDRDFLTREMIEAYGQRFAGRLYVLKRYHIENYLLDRELIAKVQQEIFNNPVDVELVGSKLRRIALRMSGEVLRNMLAYRLNLLYRPEDFSLGSLLRGQAVLDEGGCWVKERLEACEQLLCQKVGAANDALSERTSRECLQTLIADCKGLIQEAVHDGADAWKVLMPGRRLIEEYARSEGLGSPVVLQNSLIKELATDSARVPAELRRAIRTIADGRKFGCEASGGT